MSDPLLLEPGFLRRLERLAISARRTLKGSGMGERRSKRHGGTVEFADYRGYSPGDDTRRIDWYAYARLEQLFLKLYVEEQDLSLHLLIDHSASMGVGADEPDGGRSEAAPDPERTACPTKLTYARRVAVALAYIALAGGDRVSVRAVRGAERAAPFGPLRGRRDLMRLVRFLGQDPSAVGETSLGAATGDFLARKPTPGVVVLLTDLLDPAGYEGALERLRYSGHEPHVVHIVAPEEAEPQVDQDLDLVDAETGRVVTVAFDRGAVKAYREAFAAFQQRADAFCTRHGIGYVLARTDNPFEELVLRALRQRSWVR
jgi:uncharacterized protein (DUF58 family)